jgi:hypothetical protein
VEASFLPSTLIAFKNYFRFEVNNPFALDGEDLSTLTGLIAEWSAVEIAHTDIHPFQMLERLRQDKEALEGLQTVLLHLKLPAPISEAVWRKVVAIEASNRTAGLGFILFPALARMFSDRTDDLTQWLRRGLVSEDEEVAGQAVLGLYQWLRRHPDPALDIPKPHPDLVREIGIAIAARRQSVLARALDLSRWILLEGPEDYRPLLIEACEHGLGCLLEEASYARTLEEVEKLNIPLLRRNCIRLAVALTDRGRGSSPAVKGWMDAAREDPLPEVRNALVEVNPT